MTTNCPDCKCATVSPLGCCSNRQCGYVSEDAQIDESIQQDALIRAELNCYVNTAAVQAEHEAWTRDYVTAEIAKATKLRAQAVAVTRRLPVTGLVATATVTSVQTNQRKKSRNP